MDQKEAAVLGYALLFLVLALVFAVLGFGALAGIAATFAKIIFVVALVLLVVSLITGRRTAV